MLLGGGSMYIHLVWQFGGNVNTKIINPSAPNNRFKFNLTEIYRNRNPRFINGMTQTVQPQQSIQVAQPNSQTTSTTSLLPQTILEYIVSIGM
jgi:hypothetical protein